MGTWGTGNFESDTAADHLSILTGRLVDEVAEAMAGDPIEIEPDEYWGVAIPCNLELLHLIAQQGYVGVRLPDSDTIETWKQAYLSAWDAAIDGLDPKPDHKGQRRVVLVSTFDRLTDLARRKA